MEKSIGPLEQRAPVHKWVVESTQIEKQQWDIIDGTVTLRMLATVIDDRGGVSYEYVDLQLDERDAATLIDHLRLHRNYARLAEFPCTEFQREDGGRDEHQFENGRCVKCGQLTPEERR